MGLQAPQHPDLGVSPAHHVVSVLDPGEVVSKPDTDQAEVGDHIKDTIVQGYLREEVYAPLERIGYYDHGHLFVDYHVVGNCVTAHGLDFMEGAFISRGGGQDYSANRRLLDSPNH